MATKTPLIVIMAGGTGGHVFPGIAVGRRLKAQRIDVLWLGTSDGLESRVVPDEEIDFIGVRVKALRGKGLLNWLTAPWILSIAFWKILLQFIRQRPSLVLGMGGFVTGPGGVVAYLLGIPLVIHEQNAIAGLTNKCLAFLSRQVLCGFPESFKSKNVVWVGNPVRAEMTADVSDPKSGEHDRLRLLVVGGSLGASFFNEIVPQAIALIDESQRPEVSHQTGKGHLQEMVSRIAALKVHYKVFEFEEKMHELYRWADLVLCRAGAMTLAEISAAGRTAILVPYPHAVDDHQSANARYLVAENAAILVPQDQLTAAKLADLLLGFIRNRESLLEMSKAIKAAAILDADRKIADICIAEMAA